MTYNFNAVTDRRRTGSEKWNVLDSELPMWVADMDFPTAPCVRRAVEKRAVHGIFGYSSLPETWYDAYRNWWGTHHGLEIRREELLFVTGVIPAISAAVRVFTVPGEKVIIQTPVYNHFFNCIQGNGRTVLENPLTYRDGRYAMDFEDLEEKLSDPLASLLILCNPHNPVGRAWAAGELERLGEICLRNGVVVVSDEIHMDFARPGHAHTSFATLSDELVNNSVICTSASKTFNLAGLQVANIVIGDRQKRSAFRNAVSASGYSQGNTLGLVATQAAYEHGGPWLDELKDYLEGNWELLASTLKDRAPQLRLIEAESTYLAWIDCRALGLEGAALERFVEDEAGLWLDCGHIFGKDGDGFIRINIATQRAYLERALDQLCAAIVARR